MIQFYELTDYPRLYQNVYWGNFSVKHGDQDDIRICVMNRNKFIKDYNIKSRCCNMTMELRYYLNCTFFRRPTDKYDHEDFKHSTYYLNDRNLDHLEVYKTFDKKYVIVSSPYRDINDERTIQYYQERGWNKIYSLYDRSIPTFCKVYEKYNTNLI